MLAEKMLKHGTNVWLINTGWTGGSYGTGYRFKLRHTRAIVDAIHSGELDKAEFVNMPTFNLQVPTTVSGGVPTEVLLPVNTWADKEAYDNTLNHLAELFNANFVKFAVSRPTQGSSLPPGTLHPCPGCLPALPSPALHGSVLPACQRRLAHCAPRRARQAGGPAPTRLRPPPWCPRRTAAATSPRLRRPTSWRRAPCQGSERVLRAGVAQCVAPPDLCTPRPTQPWADPRGGRGTTD